MKLLFTVLICFVFLLGSSFAQEVRYVNEPDYGSPYLIFIANTEVIPELEKRIEQFENKQDCSFMIIDGGISNAYNAKDTINKILNSDQKISKEFVHLIFVGNEQLLARYHRYKNDFFANKYFLYTNKNAADWSDDLPASDFYTFSFEDLLDHLKKTYRWPIHLENIRSKYAIYSYKNKGRLGLGGGSGPVFIMAKGTEDYVPAAFNQYTLYLNRGIGKRNYLNASFSLSMKIPKPREILQQEVFGQVDVFDLILRDGDPQEINLDLNVRGHVYANLNLENRFLLTAKPNFQSYIGAGLSFTTLASFEATIDTTFILDPDSIDFGGSGSPFGSSFDRDSLADDFSPHVFTGLGIPITLGFQQRLGDRWTFDFGTRYTIDARTFYQPKKSLNMLSINVGLTYRFIGKRKVFYNYVRLKDKA